MRLHLVRHGLPRIDPALPAAQWHLDPAGLSEVERLRDNHVLPKAAAWFASSEPKAAETAAQLYAGKVTCLPELREMERPADWLEPEAFAESVVRSLEHPDLRARDGWETGRDLRTRVFGVLRGDVARHAFAVGAREIVLVGHGTAWTTLVAALTGTAPDVAAWRAMTMPDRSVLDLTMEDDDVAAAPRPSRGVVVEPWGSWRTA